MHQNKNQNKNQQHIPVLLTQVLHYLDPRPGESFLDLTAGYGGHALAILERTGSLIQVVLVDRDNYAIRELRKLFPANTVSLKQKDFLLASQELIAEGRQFDLILADLGVSSPHLNESSRGFAFNKSGPLDMRMDQNQELSAETIVNHFSEAALADILVRYGEEPKARRIAQAIVEARPLTTTDELTAVIRSTLPGKLKLAGVRRSFQAIRIAVNDEISLLETSLPLWFELLKPGGRIAVISFHSLEDRLVKQALSEVSGKRYDATFQLITKHPITASPTELVLNPRSRSAKLRVAAKIKKKGNSHAYSGKKQLPRL